MITPVLFISEACQLLRMGDGKVRALVAAGRLRCLPRTQRGRLLFTEDEIVRFLSKGTRKPRRQPLRAMAPDLVSDPAI